MAKKAGFTKKSALTNLITESLEDLQKGDFEDDPRMSDAEQLSGPERFVKGQKHKDEVVIDTLLADISGKVGYFVKLKKEVRPNEYMLMKVIESDWRKWADIESSVADIVKEHTKIAPQKWGTGAYRIEILCKGGNRGKGYDPIDYYINAEEEFNTPQIGGAGLPQAVSADVTVASRIEELSNLVGMLSSVMPKPQDPSQTQAQISQAFQQGLQIKATEGSSNNQMMTAMMTGLIGMMTAVMTNKNNDGPRVVNPEESLSKTLEVMKNFGVLGNQGSQMEKPKGIVELVTELKAIGVDLFKKDDPMENIGRLKQFASVASEMMGLGAGSVEKPSILERIIDVVGPSIPKIVSDLKETADNAVKVQALAGENIRMASQRQVGVQPVRAEGTVAATGVGEATTYQQMNGEPVKSTTMEQPVVNEQVKAFFNTLHDAMVNNNRMFYPVVYTSLLQDKQGQELLQGIANSTANAKNLIDMLQQHGDERFKSSEFVMKSMVPYVNGFMIWVRQMSGVTAPVEQPVVVAPQSQGLVNGYDVRCIACGTVYTYGDSNEFLADENKVCGNNGTCEGALEPIA